MKCSACGGTEHLSVKLSRYNKQGELKKYYYCRKCNTKTAAKYRNTTKGRLFTRKAGKKSTLKLHYKHLVRMKLNRELVKGRILKPKLCEVCNKKKKLQGHHEDYSKPLEVIWLCTGCHADAHKRLESVDKKS